MGTLDNFHRKRDGFLHLFLKPNMKLIKLNSYALTVFLDFILIRKNIIAATAIAAPTG